jgi:hypothetical protein
MTGSLYQLNVRIETVADFIDPEGDPADFDPEDVAEFKACIHRRIIFSTTSPNPGDGHGAQAVLDAYRWAVGVMARAAIEVTDRVLYSASQNSNHVCGQDPWAAHRWCGRPWPEWVTEPGGALDDMHKWAPYIEVSVPTKEAKAWLRYAKKVLGDVLASDQRPVTDYLPQEQHSRVVLLDSAPQEQHQ